MEDRTRLIYLAIIIPAILFPLVLNPTTAASGNYLISFHETGLPSDTNWSISQGTNIEYSTSNTISFFEPNGSYNFIMGKVNGYKSLPGNFSLYVQGHNISLMTIWVPVLYPVTFVEAGLPSNTFWNVTLGNETNTSSNSTIKFRVMNGTYNYSIPDVDGIAPSTTNGTIKVNGAPTKVFLKFTTPVNFTFFEHGLPAGTNWSVYINGSYYNSTSSFITVTLPNGTYSFAVLLPSGYYASPLNGKVNFSRNIIFITATSPLLYEIAIALLIVLIAVFFALYIVMRKKLKRNNKGNKSSDEKK